VTKLDWTIKIILFFKNYKSTKKKFDQMGENLLRCTIEDEKGLIPTAILVYLIF